MKLTTWHRIVAVFTWLLLTQTVVTAQVSRMQSDSLYQQPSVDFGVQKITNTFLFHGNLYALSDVFGGTLTTKQLYRGSTIRATGATFRDDEQLALQFSKPLNEEWKATGSALVSYLKDSRTQANARLERSFIAAGSMYQSKSQETNGTFLLGIERNVQRGEQSNGLYSLASVESRGISFDQFLVDVYGSAERSALGERVNSEYIARGALFGGIDSINSLNIQTEYRSLHRDFYSSYSLQNPNANALESRTETRFRVDALLLYQLSSRLKNQTNATIETNTVDRSYKSFIESFQFSGAKRTLSEFNTSVESKFLYIAPRYSHDVLIHWNSRSEENNATRVAASLGALYLDTLQQLERLRDNFSSRLYINSNSTFQFGQRDTLLVQGVAQIVRYDTPSEQNNDERDELIQSLQVYSSFQVQQHYRIGFQSRYQSLHTVFLKSQRSSLNNNNHLLSLATFVEYQTSFLSLKPKFEVMAQYTVYDFAGFSTVPQSLSFRQLLYKDTLQVPVTSTDTVEAKLFFRYYDRGELYWNSFSELPLSNNVEQFVKLQYRKLYNEQTSIGIGARWYALSQKALVNTQNYSLLQSLAPECTILWNVTSSTRVLFEGWYEFQFFNKVHTRNLPNLTMKVTTLL